MNVRERGEGVKSPSAERDPLSEQGEGTKYSPSIRHSIRSCRSYAQRRVRDGFKAAKSLPSSGEESRKALEKAKTSLEIIQRQVRLAC